MEALDEFFKFNLQFPTRKHSTSWIFQQRLILPELTKPVHPIFASHFQHPQLEHETKHAAASGYPILTQTHTHFLKTPPLTVVLDM